MKFPFRSALPPFDRTTRLPLVLAALLALALVLQLLVADDVVLPAAGPVAGGRGAGPAATDIVSAGGGADIVARAMFAPSTAGLGAIGGAASPLGSARIAGSIRIGRAAYAVVQDASGRTITVGVGGAVGDWRLRAIRKSEVVLSRGDEQVAIPFGSSGPPPASSTPSGSQP